MRSGKIGVWEYWDTSGKEKAKCDFGNGLFTLPSKTCQIIANELEPKGYSQPIPIVAIKPDSKAVIAIASQAYQLVIPSGWVGDAKAGKEEQAPLVFYPTGGTWRGSGPNIYIRVLYKSGASFDSFVKSELEGFQQNVAEYTEKATKRGKLQNGKPTLSKTITYKPLIQTDSPFSIVSDNTIHETISYLDASDQVVVMVVLACHSEPTYLHPRACIKEQPHILSPKFLSKIVYSLLHRSLGTVLMLDHPEAQEWGNYHKSSLWVDRTVKKVRLPLASAPNAAT